MFSFLFELFIPIFLFIVNTVLLVLANYSGQTSPSTGSLMSPQFWQNKTRKHGIKFNINSLANSEPLQVLIAILRTALNSDLPGTTRSRRSSDINLSDLRETMGYTKQCASNPDRLETTSNTSRISPDRLETTSNTCRQKSPPEIVASSTYNHHSAQSTPLILHQTPNSLTPEFNQSDVILRQSPSYVIRKGQGQSNVHFKPVLGRGWNIQSYFCGG